MQLATVHPLDIAASESRSSRVNGSKPPLKLRGYVEDAAYEGILADILENVSDVAWPTSVTTYNQMRRDSKLSAIIDGYVLQILRAQWQLDPTDCRPEVVQLLADDMDLPVKGKEQRGAARTRGVSWPEHLQAALTMLPFGHSGFELEAKMVDGRARLVGVWDRPQHTISQIHVKPKTGEFNGISQELALGPFDKPEIGPDRLAWYAHKREGAQWFGTSLLRPAFGPWLFKKEMMRAEATANRRFAMGIPTVEWAPSSTPTPQQFSEAQKAITAARVGDQSGVTMPPGAMMRLVGLSGGVPDTLAFLKWLDQQMSTTALMQHLDLGQTETGSRALGESFIDSWTLALEAIGDEIAVAASRQIAARIVGWNWGQDEPVPRVTVSGIGSRREVTAQSLQLLLDSGALAADPGLEEWVRREYRLPAPDRQRPVRVQNPDQPPPGVQASASPPKGEPASSRRTGSTGSDRVQPATPVQYEQPELPIAAQAEPGASSAEAEPDDDDELQETEDDSAAALAAILAAWPLLAAPLVETFAAGATVAAASGALGTLGSLTAPASAVDDIASAVTQTMLSLGTTSVERAHDGITRQGVDLDAPQFDPDPLRQYAQAVTELIVGGYRSAAARAALNAAGPDADPDRVGEAARRAMDDLTSTSERRGGRGFVAGELGAALHAAAHWGRVAVFGALDRLGLPVTWQADESNEDRNRCRPCGAIHRTTFPTLAMARAAYPAGKYVGCQGRQRCRGHLRARVRGVVARVWNEADHPRDHRGRFRKLLSMDIAGDLDVTRMSEHRLTTLFAEFVAESPPNEAALLKLNAELERRERQAERDRDPDPLRGVDLTDLSEDHLLDLWSEHRSRDEVRQQIDAEFTERRRRSRSVGDEPIVDWGQDTPDTPDSPEQRRIDELVSGGLDYRDAYAEVYDLSEQDLRGQERGLGAGRTRAEVRRAYRDFTTLQMLEAENDLNGHLLSPQGRAQGVDPLSLFSGPASRARKWASEDLRRWWADHPRVTFAEFEAHMAGASRRGSPAETAVFATPEVPDADL